MLEQRVLGWLFAKGERLWEKFILSTNAKTAARVQIHLTQRYLLTGRLRSICSPLPCLPLKGEIVEKLTVVIDSLSRR